ncbi:MAG TPA: hypothetical protein VH394_13900, partial [Thermoanaerobaculia bacterium]|nr:hypothetical protein [Thermoanaerobaculia bacterium]
MYHGHLAQDRPGGLSQALEEARRALASTRCLERALDVLGPLPENRIPEHLVESSRHGAGLEITRRQADRHARSLAALDDVLLLATTGAQQKRNSVRQSTQHDGGVSGGESG